MEKDISNAGPRQRGGGGTCARRSEAEPVSRSPELAEGKRVRRTARKGLLEVRS
jgi:hypothetical protein